MRNKNAKVSDPNSFVTNSGEEYKLEYSPHVMPDGTIELEVSGRININDYINSQREQTDMSYILKQIALGNNEVLSQSAGMYGDFTGMPKTFAEALQMRIDAENSFYKLPVDVRLKFENDFNRYFATAGSEEWFEKLGVTKSDEKESVPEATAE